MKKYLALLFIFFAAIAFAGVPGGPPPPKTGLKTYTVATVPTASTHLNMAIIVVDGDDDTDCETTGGGTTRNICISDGTNWIIAGDGAATSVVEDAPYGSGWNDDTTHAPSQNAVYDRIHIYDTDDDGDIDAVDGAVGGGDITAVGPGGTGAGDALTDGYVTQDTTSMFIWEGPTDDTVEYNFVLPAADPITADTNWTYPSESGTFIVGEADGYADNTVLAIDGTGGHLTQETTVTIDDSNHMGGIANLTATGVIDFTNTTEASAIGTAALITDGGLSVAKDIWLGDDLVLDSDSAVISLGADQDIIIKHTADQGITVFEGTEEILILKDGGSGSAVNEITILSAATTASPTIQQTGEADIGIDFETVNNEEMLQLDAVAAGTNNLKIANAANGVSPSIVAVGSSDANVGISIDAKAAGEIIIGSADAKFSLVSDALDISNAGNISNAGTIGCGKVTSSAAFESATGLFDVTGAAAITVGSADVTVITLSTDDTGDGTDVVLPAQSVNGSEILNNTITATQLNAVITLADGDLVNFGGITMSGTNDEGLVLPLWGDTTPTTDQPYITYDAAANAIKIFEGGWVTIGATAAPTDATYLTLSLDGTLSAERVLTEGTNGIDFVDGGANTTLTINFDGTEVDAITWSDSANATNTWTFDVSGTDTTMIAGSAMMSFSHDITVTGNDIIFGNAETISNATNGSLKLTDGTNEIAIFKTVGSAAAELTFSPATTGGNPVISTTGENDAGIVFQNTEGEEFLVLDSVGTDVNYLQVLSSAAGTGADNQVSLTAVGDDTHIGLIIDPKGAGTLTLGTSDSLLAIASTTFNVTAGALTGITTAAMSGALTIQGAINLGTGGVVFTDDGDGLLTITGAGDGADENLTFNFDDTADTVVINTGTSVGTLDFSAIDLTTTGDLSGATITASTALALGDNDNFNLGASAPTTDWYMEYNSTNVGLLFSSADIASAATTTGMYQIKVNSGGGTLTDDQEVFEILNNTTELLSLDENGDLTIAGKFSVAASADPYLQFNVVTATDTDWWITVDDDAESDDDDPIKFSTTGQNDNTPEFEFQTDGDFIAEGSLTGTALILDDGENIVTIGPGTLSATKSYTWPVTTPAVSGYALTSTTAGAMSWTELTATAAGSDTEIQWKNAAGALDAEAEFTYDDSTNTLNITKEGSNPAITVGDGNYDIGNSALVFIEGVLEVEEIAYLDGGADINEDLDINLSDNTEEVNITADANDYTAGSGLLTIYDDSTGQTAASYLLRLAHEANGDAHDHFILCEDSSTGAAANGDDMFYVNSGGAVYAAGAVDIDGDLSLGAAPANTGGAVGDILMSNATAIYFEADEAGTDVYAIGVDSSEIVQIGASGASGVTITPTTTITGALTMSANPKIYDGNSHHLTLDVEDLAADATIILGSETNNLTIKNGTATIDVAAAADLNLDVDFTVDGQKTTITGADQANTITLNESFIIGGGYTGTLTFTGETKILSVEDTAVVSQDYSSDASPTFAALSLTSTITGATGLTLGSATTDAADDLIMIQGAQTGNPQFSIALSDDANGHTTLAADTGNITLSAANNDMDIVLTVDDAGTDKSITIDGSESTVNFGADDLYLNLIVHDGGTLTMYDDSNDFSIALGVTNGASTLALTGAMTVSTTLSAATYGSTGAVTDAELLYVADVTGLIQAQLDLKAPADSPTFTTAFTATGLIGDEDLQSEDFGEFTCAGEDACTIDDSVTVTGWTMGASVATTPTYADNDTSLATTAFVDDVKFVSLAVAALEVTATPSVLTVQETTNTCVSNYKSSGADHVFTMPAAHANGNVIFMIGDEFQVDIEPDTDDLFYLNGTAMAANEHIQNTADTLGERIACYVANINGTLRWMCYSGDAAWVEETP